MQAQYGSRWSDIWKEKIHIKQSNLYNSLLAGTGPAKYCERKKSEISQNWINQRPICVMHRHNFFSFPVIILSKRGGERKRDSGGQIEVPMPKKDVLYMFLFLFSLQIDTFFYLSKSLYCLMKERRVETEENK